GSGVEYFPLIVEVALILLFGMVLARLLEAAGSMSRISSWVESLSPNRPLGGALVVSGIVPFAETVAGLGIGVPCGVPIRRHRGCTLRQSALLGLLGLIAVPWGALGPGTTVAAALAGFDVDELGLSTAWLNAIPVVIVTIVVIAIMRPRPTSALGIIGSAGLLWLGILGASLTLGMVPAVVIGFIVVIAIMRPRPTSALGIIGSAGLLWLGSLGASLIIGMAPAGVIGSLAVIVVVGAGFVSGKRRTGFTRRLGSAVLPYGVLTVGL